MSNVKKIAAVVSLLLCVWCGPALAQQAQADLPPDKARAEQAVAQFQQRALQNVKQALGSNDDEFKVLEPKLTRVMLLLYQQSAGFTLFGRRRGSTAFSAVLPPSEVQKARIVLREAIDNKDSTPTDIADKLKAFREARAAARAELVQAQDDLRQFLTMKQEATLVSMGLLD
ncbi:MAG TPA: hypothetical protein VK797_20365 [Tepidisphaeraceae bacterium]|jgi:hypothetical protein|nr:hypothetical protein [Tepidisphaeraceae bacterium]